MTVCRIRKKPLFCVLSVVLLGFKSPIFANWSIARKVRCVLLAMKGWDVLVTVVYMTVLLGRLPAQRRLWRYRSPKTAGVISGAGSPKVSPKLDLGAYCELVSSTALHIQLRPQVIVPRFMSNRRAYKRANMVDGWYGQRPKKTKVAARTQLRLIVSEL